MSSAIVITATTIIVIIDTVNTTITIGITCTSCSIVISVTFTSIITRRVTFGNIYTIAIVI